MGKAKRVKAQREEAQRRIDEAKDAKRRARRETLVMVVAVIVVLAVVAGVVFGTVFAYKTVRSTGNYLRNKVAVYSEHFEVNNAMLAYIMYDNFDSSVSTYYYYYYYYYGFDYTSALKTQYYDEDSGTTWYDYFLDAAISIAESYLVLCEAAYAEGVELEETDYLAIERCIQQIEYAASSVDYEIQDYLDELYGVGVQEDDIRDALELYYLALKYDYIIADEAKATDEEIEEYYTENESDYIFVSYKTYTFEASYDDDADDDAIAEAQTEASEAANALAAATTSDEFDELLTEYLESLETDEDDITDALEDAFVEDETEDEDEDYSVWLFDEERELYETTVIAEDDDTYTVYMITSLASRQEYTTKTVRHILFSTSYYEDDDACLAAAEAVLELFKSGDMTEDAFALLVAEYSDDSGSSAHGGIYDDILKGVFVDEFEDWAYDEDREYGDVEIIESDYGYHIMFFVGDGMTAWMSDINDTLVEEEVEEVIDELSEVYTVTSDSSIASGIPDVNNQI
ncbi:MAG: peptidyl-prolyl cis-trans isomerase [Firmicutes bacterium]|nr:peptidyl-prolyl cis-trans isomerase [Bacillota bacterium]